ncbi:hypothetical protein GCM10022223_56650 [Kineosporia mesophila]|uniref:DUF2029 domain-containing protein n=1 Tax=Kineosporia mesophila TaxID=566012 RepID=A0ABP7AFL8_9ACTN|nr:hypothetical protein [Kineosporia mesophila]MCD5354408.1 hypothetical protein [Kineosporia mesophila]
MPDPARLRWVLCLVAALEVVVLKPIRTYDLAPFSVAGHSILTGHLSSVYADSWMQAGPFELLASWALNPSAGGDMRCLTYGGADPFLRAAAGAVITAALMLFTRHLRRVHDLLPSPAAELVAGLAAVVLMLPVRWCSEGHLAQIAIPVLWIWATSLMIRGKMLSAALLVGLSAGWEPWGVLAAGLLLIERRPVPLARSGVVCVAAAIACYLPFAATGHFAMFELSWPVVRDTLWGQLLPGELRMGWLARLLQGLFAGLAGCALALVLGRRHQLLWLGPLSVILVRLVLDPMILGYYWYAALVILAVGSGLSTTRWPAGALLLMAAPIVQLHPYYWHWQNTWYLPAVACLALGAVVALERRSGPDQHDPVLDDLESRHHGVNLTFSGEGLDHSDIPRQLGEGSPGRRHQGQP